MTSLRGMAAHALWRGGATLFVAHASLAQSHACPHTVADPLARASMLGWASPLDRTITLPARGTTLRDALDRLAGVAKFRISYSPELLPLDRTVCLSADAAPVGWVLTALLAGTDVAPIAVGGDHIVLAPYSSTAQSGTPGMARSLGVLNRVIVTGTSASVPADEVAINLRIVSGSRLAREHTGTLSNALDSYVPGVWSWSQSPSSILSSYGSIRGASSFGLSYPKLYIDGIEVANPLLVTRFAPEAIDRIEVIRGPQGSALYGTDAISGVVNVVTSHDGPNDERERGSVQSSAGVTESAFSHKVFRQEHSVSLLAGSAARSVNVHVTGGSIGDFIPNGSSRDLVANAGIRFVGARATLEGSARLFMEDAGSGSSPLLTNTGLLADAGTFRRSTGAQSVREYTVGATGTLAANGGWTHSIVAGLDAYSLGNVQTNVSLIPSVLDSALRAAEGTAGRGTMRLTSVRHAGGDLPTRSTFAFNAEHTLLRESLVSVPHADPATRAASRHSGPPSEVSWQYSTGVGVVASAVVENAVFLTAAVRTEYDTRLAGVRQIVVLPMLGGASVGEFGPVAVKLRAAYGKGVRRPSPLGHAAIWHSGYGSGNHGSLGSEEQSGVEAGVDLMLRHAWSLKVTRFDQRAFGLIQKVSARADSDFQDRDVTSVLQNVGEIANRGWEIEAASGVSKLSASGTLSLIDSRVTKLARGYSGDLAVGERTLQVPAITGSLNVSWQATRWIGSLGAARALDWINYDEIALSSALRRRGDASGFGGIQLRQYWRQYNGGVHLRAFVSRDLRDKFVLDFRAENLLNHQRGEPDDITVVPGRTIMTGFRVKF